MMSIMIVEARKQNFAFVVFVVSIGVLKKDETATLGNINSVVCDFETNRYVKIISEVDLFIRFSVVVCIFKNDQFVLRERIADPVVGVAGHCRNPEPAFIVKSYLDRVG